MAGGTADELFALNDAVFTFIQDRASWPRVKHPDGNIVVCVPLGKLTSLVSVYLDVQDAMDAIEEAEGGKAE